MRNNAHILTCTTHPQHIRTFLYTGTSAYTYDPHTHTHVHRVTPPAKNTFANSHHHIEIPSFAWDGSLRFHREAAERLKGQRLTIIAF